MYKVIFLWDSSCNFFLAGCDEKRDRRSLIQCDGDQDGKIQVYDLIHYMGTIGKCNIL